MTDDDRDPTTVELWMRSFAPTATGPKHVRALETLETLEGVETVDSVSIHVWGAAFERLDRERRIPQLERIETTLDAFERWATQAGRDLEPFFRTRRVESTFTDESFVVCRLPTLALAEYRGEDLVHVAPSCDGGRTVDVLDRLEALLAGDVDESVLGYDEEQTRDSESAGRGSAAGDGRRPFWPRSED